MVIKENKEFVPAYGEGALYIRPVLMGSGAQLGLRSADEFLFYILVTPVNGSYYGSEPVAAYVVTEFDRSAPLGMGAYKVAGNYAPTIMPNNIAASKGGHLSLYLDPKEHKFIEEFNSSNFIAVLKDGTYVTPHSPNVLPSITNDSLISLAQDFGLDVAKRPIEFLKEVGNFSEVAATGTAAMCTLVTKIYYNDKEFSIPVPRDGGRLVELADALRAIQLGEEKDLHRWMLDIVRG